VANPKIKLNLVPNHCSNGNVSFRSLQNFFRGNNKPNPYYYENTFATLSFDTFLTSIFFAKAQTIVPLLEKQKHETLHWFL
jgi:hypothetical protein